MPVSSETAFRSPGILRLPVRKISAEGPEQTFDPVAIEQPLEIRIRYGSAPDLREHSLSITMRTPGNDSELALGWLYTEGIIPAASPQVIGNLSTHSAGDSIIIDLPGQVIPDLSRSQRHSYTSSSCGVCGKTSLEALHAPAPQQQNDESLTIPAALLHTLPPLLRANQDIFEATGGVHAAGLFDAGGNLLALREDIGRHNALDKLIGHTLRQELPLAESILLLSGRACFELIQKAAVAGIRIVAAVGPPSSLAVHHAEETGITLVGFLRQHRFNIYSNAHRIKS